MDIQSRLFSLQDKEYALFQAKLIPGISQDEIIGVRIPEVRKLAKSFIKEEEHLLFMRSLPHRYYDEDMLHGVLISEIKDYQGCIDEVDKFLPYVDNWAVCDIMSPKVFKKHKSKLISKIIEWAGSDSIYTCRFGLGMLMSHYLDGDFNAEYLEIAAEVQSVEYYVKMMVAWFFATALAKQWNYTISYIENHRLGIWTHNKTIQKAIESHRITDEKKEYLRSLKR